MQNYCEKSPYAIPKWVRLHFDGKIYPNGYGIGVGVILILHQEKQTDMTNEEKQMIKECRIMIVGKGDFITYIKEELDKLGFGDIADVAISEIINYQNTGILIEYTGVGHSQSSDMNSIPVIYPFDFVDGAGAIVVFPEDERDWLGKQNMQQWAAEYMSGYCAFWNVEGCDWLHDALPAIKENRTNKDAMKTAAHICARIAANIAVGRDVKRYPHFYLCRNLK